MSDAYQQIMPFWWRLRAAYWFVRRGGCSPRLGWNLAKTFNGGDDREPEDAVADEMDYWEP